MKHMSFDGKLHGPFAYSMALQTDVTELVLATQNSILPTTGACQPFLECPSYLLWDLQRESSVFPTDPLSSNAYFCGANFCGSCSAPLEIGNHVP